MLAGPVSGGKVNDGSLDCAYDPEGRLYLPCEHGAWAMAMDHGNVIRVGPMWRFAHGPGVDDPLIGRIAYANGTVREVFFVTDGQGRQLSLGEPNGTFANAPWADSFDDYKQYRWAGAATKAFSFAAERQSNANQPEISLFRNRAYDSRSGRWLQEDPIGIAGGINLYQFNGNNPVAYTDPFGLCPKQDLLCQVFVSGAQALGGAAGFFGGLAEGGLEGLACGPAAPACSPALALTNAVAGAIAIGTAAGKAADAIMSGTEPLQMARAGRGGGNSAENRASNQIKKEYRFTPEGENAFHTEIGRLKKFYDVKSLTEEQLREAADIVRQNAKYIRPPE
ncbi:MAG: RHS repeat-associated core domain-containing protein [Gemmatimonadetes bacterium]|nr:RHS repeat-associated core domain-containing protein [Gemmatimonadota bacterium]MBK6779734.1 RHS repeat-associated core domain-containing protein [Gemmatimonadota bacterium]MBK7922030.1 RHS repeat-associated core domain-containing protein [Gemmatimonadota bacterium]MBK9065277.1 RHS repeat-associated core domain-containing protein [Gemmatimonadota bacterium]